jgi:hypothetical protein
MNRQTPILFYNFFHNGDLLNSKAFVKEIMDNMPITFMYAHSRHTKILTDMNLIQIRPEQIFPVTTNDHKQKMIVADNITLVNTWIGAYFEPDGECTLRFSYNMYKRIYDDLNKVYGTNLKLDDDITKYFPFVDFSQIDVSKVDAYLAKDKNRKVLICNGPALSNQCSYNENMSDIVLELADTYKDTTFICTQHFDTDVANIAFTDVINEILDCDLNEIAYLSKFCDIIVGRSSGPFSFSCLKDNMDDENKKFICFGDKITDCFQYGVDTKAKFVFEKFTSKSNLLNVIKKELND